MKMLSPITVCLTVITVASASAQSSVSISGTLDLSARYVKNDGSPRRLSLGQDGINSSQLVFSGREDLGDGLYTSFAVNMGLNPEAGSTNDPTQLFNRQSILNLGGNWGEIRLGRDYTPIFWNAAYFDPFGTVGVGNTLSNYQMLTGAGIRTSNSIGYVLPSGLGGAYGQLMVAASEGGIGNPGRVISGRAGYKAGSFDVAAAFGAQRLDALPGAPSQDTYNVGGSYDLNVVKLMGWAERNTLSYAGVDNKETRYEVGAVVPFGLSEFHAAYNRSKLTDINGGSNSISKWALGYVYFLSKRTALYSSVSRLSNGAASSMSVLSVSAMEPGQEAAPPVLGGKSTGFEAGFRHFF